MGEYVGAKSRQNTHRDLRYNNALPREFSEVIDILGNGLSTVWLSSIGNSDSLIILKRTIRGGICGMFQILVSSSAVPL